MKKSDYLQLGEGPTMQKLKEIIRISDFIGDNLYGIQVEINLGDYVRKYPMTYFKPTDADEEETTIDYIDNLLYTMEINPVESVTLTDHIGNKLEM